MSDRLAGKLLMVHVQMNFSDPGGGGGQSGTGGEGTQISELPGSQINPYNYTRISHTTVYSIVSSVF